MVLALERESGVGAEGGTSPSCFQPALHRMGTGWAQDGHRDSSSWNPPRWAVTPSQQDSTSSIFGLSSA